VSAGYRRYGAAFGKPKVALLHDNGHVPKGVNVFEGITLNNKQVRSLADLKAASISKQPQYFCIRFSGG
jgi:hypothetical protein